MPYEFQLSDTEWRQRLPEQTYQVLRRAATERPWTGALLDEHRTGEFKCAGCGNELFKSETKFDSGCGWPAFSAPAEDAVEEETGKWFHFEGSEGLPLDHFAVLLEADREEVLERALPFREGEEVHVEIIEPHMYSAGDAVAKIDGYIIQVKGGTRYVGEKHMVRIEEVGRTAAIASLVDVAGARPGEDPDSDEDELESKPRRRGRRGGRRRSGAKAGTAASTSDSE